MKWKQRSARFRRETAHRVGPAPAASTAPITSASPIYPLVVSLYLISRNLVPVIGVLLLGWSAAQQLILYFIDTLLGMVVVFALMFQLLFPIEREDGAAARINAAAGVFGYSILIVAFMAIPLGVPLIFVLGSGGFSVSELLTQNLLVALAIHVVLALLTLTAMFREMGAVKEPERALKRQFGWILMRWVVVILIIYTGVPTLLGRIGALLIVIAYAAFGIAADFGPRTVARVLRLDDEAN